jgi:hypothetical protein
LFEGGFVQVELAGVFEKGKISGYFRTEF